MWAVNNRENIAITGHCKNLNVIAYTTAFGYKRRFHCWLDLHGNTTSIISLPMTYKVPIVG